MANLQKEKVHQAIQILEELQVDAWLTFVRETTESGDTVLPIILGQQLTWQSALLITRQGDCVAIVGNYDADAVRSLGVWSEVIPYVEGIRDALVGALKRLDPQKIAINFSQDDVKADGLSHGMFLLLQKYLAETPYGNRLVSAEEVVNALRGRKTPAEVARIRAAIETTDAIFAEVARYARPGWAEVDVAKMMKDLARQKGVELAWAAEQCPIVNTGPDSMIGHGIPSKLIIEAGHIFHVDFGVRQEEYCSDIQRTWYVPHEGEGAAPPDVQRAFDTVVAAIQAAAKALKPGVECWQVDEAARQVVIGAGYPEYMHATGHHVGRSAHDGGGVLGPRWERYGRTPYRVAEVGNVFTLELGVENVDSRGYVGLEDMVLVTESGCEFLSTPQTKLPLLA